MLYKRVKVVFTDGGTITVLVKLHENKTLKECVKLHNKNIKGYFNYNNEYIEL